ncbi:ATP synthase epsilon chain [Candidatus Johnevansia muelleri]|uniref:ATP synthase epsilon chain n=1 Tax=Candidatus Johnevansia muelleri TaxID=1495769 RepID=A0A078KIC4_9GAMM|nr:ATP synthase epsilon chain [Candidatus Evansia muelleri]
MINIVKCDIVSAESTIFSGNIIKIIVTGIEGELCIMPGHAPLLTTLLPAPVKIFCEGGEKEIFYISSGFLEIQPNLISILSDVALRAIDLDEYDSKKAYEQAKQLINNVYSNLEFKNALIEIAKALARLRTIKMLKNNH